MNKVTWAKNIGAALAVTMMTPTAATAQFSESYNFLKAIRDRDGVKVTEIIKKPGSVIIDTRDQSTGETGLHIVTLGRDVIWLNFLLSNAAKPDVRDNKGVTPLIIATKIRFAEGVTMLLRRGASVDLANNSGETPLIIAVQNRDLALVEQFLTAGANPAKKDRVAGMSARDYAVRDTRASVILKAIDNAKPVKPAAGPKL
ncbi:MAG: ankyrin repeat domain-containing protein [Chakrabartia sp.]